MMSLPKSHLRQVNLQRGQKQRGLAQSGNSLHVSEFGDNLKVHKSSFEEILELFPVFYIILFLVKSLSNFSKFPIMQGRCLCEKVVERCVL